MPRSSPTRRVVFAFAAAQLLFAWAPLPAQAASLTLNDPNCDSFELSGSPGTQVLTCVVSNTPSCQINGASTVTVNTQTVLTASCTGSPKSYLWTGGACQNQTAQSCTVTHGVAGPVTYGVTAANNVGTGGPASKDVIWTDQPVVQAPTGCSLTASPSTTTAGQTVTLTANCSGGGAPTAWTWTGNGVNASTLGNSQQIFASSQTTTYTVTPSNTGGNGNNASATVTISGGTGGNGGIIQSCPGFATTKVIEATFPASGGSNKYYYTSSNVFSNASPGFGANDAIVLRFTTPASDTYMNVSMYETGATNTGQPSYRTVTLSREACDFQVPKSANALFAVQSTGFSINVSVASQTTRYNLAPNTTYFVNVNNYLGGSPACTNNRCDVFFLFTNPQ